MAPGAGLGKCCKKEILWRRYRSIGASAAALHPNSALNKNLRFSHQINTLSNGFVTF